MGKIKEKVTNPICLSPEVSWEVEMEPGPAVKGPWEGTPGRQNYLCKGLCKIIHPKMLCNSVNVLL